jgi:hypothetical protein
MNTRSLSPAEERRLRAEQERLIKEEADAAARLARLQSALDATTTKLNESERSNMRSKLTPLGSLSRRATPSAAPPSAPVVVTADEHRALAERQAAFILRSAAKARGEVIEDPEPIDSRAEAILRAGRLRRNEE